MTCGDGNVVAAAMCTYENDCNEPTSCYVSK